ncbi:MAG: hypothetical protein J1E62_11080 [Lachnospiraceae bacterium]|nr:hypothetical protein [Lachnospiraceae bacterium]
MSILLVKGEAYEYNNKEEKVLFSEDGTHKYLFNFISANITPVLGLFEQYFSARIDMETFDPISGNKGGSKLTKIKNFLESVHPYYKYRFDPAIFNTIGEYFNDMLIYSKYSCHNSAIPQEMTKEWYMERFWALMPNKMPPDGNEKGPDDFFVEYQKRAEKWNVPDDTWEVLLSDIPNRQPVPFSFEIRMQNEIANMLYFILDIDAKDVNVLSVQQRMWLYENISGTGLSVAEKLPSCEQTLFSDMENNHHKEEIQKLKERFKKLNYSLYGRNVVRNGVSEKLQEEIASAVSLAKAINPSEISEKYEITDLRQLLLIEILHMIQNNTMIRVCKNCGKYFVVTNRNFLYCDGFDDSGHKCSDVGSNNTFKKKMAADEAYTIYSRAYKARYARQQRGKMSRGEFIEWNNEAMEKRDKVRAGEYDLEEFREWLKK